MSTGADRKKGEELPEQHVHGVTGGMGDPESGGACTTGASGSAVSCADELTSASDDSGGTRKRRTG